MTKLTNVVTVAVIVACYLLATPALAQNNTQNNSCMALTMLVQGKLQPFVGWHGTVKGLLVDKANKVYPLEGRLSRPLLGEMKPPVYTGQVGHETFPFAFDLGPAGKFAGLIDHEIAQFSPSLTPHLDLGPPPPPFVLGSTKSTFKVVPQTAGTGPEDPNYWRSSGWFESATGNLWASATFLVNSIPADYPDPEFPEGGPIIGYWNIEVTGKLCNVTIQPK